MLTAVAVVLLLLVALLAIPATLEFEIAWRKALEQNVRLRWAFGLVRVRISPGESQSESPSRGKPGKKAKRAKRSSRGPKNVLGAIRDRGFRRRVMRFARDFWHAVRKEGLRLRLRIGLGDPADTGRLWALVGPIAGMLAVIREVSVEIEPEFYDPALELDMSGSVTVIPLQLIYLLVGLMFSPSVWRGLKVMRN